MLKLQSLKAYNVLGKKEVNIWDLAEMKKKKIPKSEEEEKKNLLLGGITHLKIKIHVL